MADKLYLTHEMLYQEFVELAKVINNYQSSLGKLYLKAYAIPRGGIPVAYKLSGMTQISIVDNPEEADIFIDDLIDSGTTRERMCDEYPGRPFFALIDKTDITLVQGVRQGWLVFPWEVTVSGSDESGTDIVTRLLQFVGEDVKREGLQETPRRVMKAWKHWTEGYSFSDVDIKNEFKAFEDGAEDYDQMIIRRNIPIYSHCEHHLAAIFGTCTVAYIPKTKVLGLSKMDRVVNIFARRLQVQERLTSQIANAMWKHLDPIGVGVYINARHMCIESRGVCHQNSETITTALRGAMKSEHSTKSEFLAACRG